MRQVYLNGLFAFHCGFDACGCPFGLIPKHPLRQPFGFFHANAAMAEIPPGLREKLRGGVCVEINIVLVRKDKCDQTHTNGLENYWALLKRTISGTYVSVEPFHLFRYLDQQAYRFNNHDKELNDFDRFKLAMTQVMGKRLTWNTLTGKDADSATCNN